MSPDLQAHIGVRLKAFYDSVLSEPIPDRFAELLDRLDAAGKSPDVDSGRDTGGGRASLSAARDVKAAGGDAEADLNGGSDSDVRQ